ncbi:unnamed protein product [Prorocentrum cordatum]|uniref:RNase H type-1 domain-containing protein n=1 Tax=Prorocentrum cordatum TaxID=2364126 RepID=A0ABN9VML3_9DINO|nr:unnamed protein product [Polarella glacialis]
MAQPPSSGRAGFSNAPSPAGPALPQGLLPPPLASGGAAAGAGAEPAPASRSPPAAQVAMGSALVSVAASALNFSEMARRAFVSELGGAWESCTLNDILDCKGSDLLSAADTMEVGGSRLRSIPKGALLRQLRELAVTAGFARLGLGGLPVALPPSTGIVPAGAQTAAPQKFTFASALRSGDSSEFCLLPAAKVRTLSAECKKAHGDQLSALAARLADDALPRADFSIFGPFGKRLMKLMACRAKVFVNGELITKTVQGPGSFEQWRRCFRALRTGFLKLGVSKPGPLDTCEEGFRQLAESSPGHWGHLVVIEDHMRSERRSVVRERIEDQVERNQVQGTWGPPRPWEAALAATACGPTSATEGQWWFLRVDEPCLQAPTTRGAAAQVAAVEGAAFAEEVDLHAGTNERKRTARGGGASPPRTKKQKQKDKWEAKHAAMLSTGRRPDGRHLKGPDGAKLCYDWNRSRNGYSAPCPNRRAHLCEWCLGPHRACDDSARRSEKRPRGWSAPAPKGKAKGSGKGPKSKGGAVVTLPDFLESGVDLRLDSHVAAIKSWMAGASAESLNAAVVLDPHAAILALCAAEFGFWVMVADLGTSYMWRLPDMLRLLEFGFLDCTFSPCQCGADFDRPTRLRCFSLTPPSMRRRCQWVQDTGAYSCGRSEAWPHLSLSYSSYGDDCAREHADGAAEAWATDIPAWGAQRPEALSAGAPGQDPFDRRQVHAHPLRVPFVPSAREVRSQEGARCAAGLRNPEGVVRKWVELRARLHPVRQALLAARGRVADLQLLSKACGESPARPPPATAAIRHARELVSAALGLSQREGEMTRPASPLHGPIFDAVCKRSGDSDVHVAPWILEGAPMGIEEPVRPGGHFPARESPAARSPEALQEAYVYQGNHVSFSAQRGEAEAPTPPLIREYLEAGYGEIFSSQQAAESALGHVCYPAPLGNVRRPKKSGGWKNRIIQDLKVNFVNAASSTHERTVLPRGIDHAVDIATLAQRHESMVVLILDFSDAFTAVPLHDRERPCNCAAVRGLCEEGVEHFIVRRVLGFGGKSNPLVYSRVWSFAARTGQALLDGGRSRLQLYVDDPEVVVSGPEEVCRQETDILLLWWLCLGFKLSWSKGSSTMSGPPVARQAPKEGPIGMGGDALIHDWVGIRFALRGATAVMGLTAECVESTRLALAPFLQRSGQATLAQARTAVGKAARVAQVIPEATPFVAALWGALAGSLRAAARGASEAAPGKVAVVRYFAAAGWLDAVLREPQRDGANCGTLFPLVRTIHHFTPGGRPSAAVRVEFDASPWGGGAVLAQGTTILVYFSIEWDGHILTHFGAELANPRWQTVWEMLTLLLSLLVWGTHAEEFSLTLHGDNIGALQNALSLKGHGHLLAIAREIAWRKARFCWEFDVVHLPSELNQVADALSRLTAAPPKTFPKVLQEHRARRREVPCWNEVWQAWVGSSPPKQAART